MLLKRLSSCPFVEEVIDDRVEYECDNNHHARVRNNRMRVLYQC